MFDEIDLFIDNNRPLVNLLGGLFLFIMIGVPIIKDFLSDFLSKEYREGRKKERLKKQKIREALIYKEEKEEERRKEELKQTKIEEDKKNYQKYLNLRKEIEQMPIYQRWRQDVLKKCDNKCQICGHTNNLEVHHRISVFKILKYFKVSSIEGAFECKPLWDIDNGDTLCKECHDKMESSKVRNSLTKENDL